ncbi:unnamed protein product [Withania somnifera]
MPQIPKRSVFTLSLISLLLSYTLLRSRNQTLTLTTSTESESYTTAGPHEYQEHWRLQSYSRNYIVRFHHYKETEDLHNYLQKNVKFKGWEWLERKILPQVKKLLLENLRKLVLVKDVSLDLSYQRVVLEEKNEKIGAFINENKMAGKIFTAMSFSEDKRYAVANTSNMKISWKRELLMQERTNWTNEDTLNDNLGHGTFVAGVIAGQDEECLGFAPDTEIYAFRVFTDAQVSYTSWFLDAFNYAIATNMDVLNLSIGGPDYLDLPFVEKVWELTANNIIMVSANGNDGQLYLYSKQSSRSKLESFEILMSYEPRASIFPGVLDYNDCPYSWPFCRQPLYAGAMPVIFNAAILNGMAVIGYVESPPAWHPSSEEGNLLSVHFTYSDVIWPWTGYLALHMQIKEEGAQFSGVIEGNITVKIYSPPAPGEKSRRSSTCVLQLKLKVIPTPPRSMRILWDQFHSIKYPPGYIPKDSLDVRSGILDWHGDYLHTNFHIIILALTCFDARHYGTLLVDLEDLEDEYFPEEIKKLRDDAINSGLSVVVFADWYNVDTMVKMRFFDDNTRSWWTPVIGGSNTDTPILGLLEVGGGRIAVYGDSNCLDSSHMVTNCYGLLKKMLDFTSRDIKDPMLFSDSVRQEKPLYVDTNQLPSCRTDVNFSTYSSVIGKELTCGRDSRFEVWGTKGYNLQVRGRNRKLPGYHVIDLGRGLNSTIDTTVTVTSNMTQKDLDFPGNNYWSFFYRDDIDMPMLVTTHWLVPAIVAITGLLILFWRMQKRRR